VAINTNARTSLVTLLFLLVIATAANAKTIYVDADRPGGGGTSWDNAYNYLQDGLADANASAKPVEIRVAQGTYKPDEGAGVTDGDRTATFQLINDVILKGGYAGFGEPDPNAWDVSDYETILSGDLDGNDVPVATSDLLNEPTRAENSLHVAYANDVNATAIQGFTITGGNANVTVYPDSFGGGLRSIYCSLIVQNCTFVANSAHAYGGGMTCFNGQNAEISDCNFTGNWGGTGGGLAGGSLAVGGMIVTNCQFNNNGGNISGGGLYSSGYSSLINCVFNSNTSDSRGGGIRTFSGDTTLSDCIFINNTAETEGGGIFNGATITLTNCTFIGNSTTSSASSGQGGGMCTCDSDYDHTLINCTFIDNSAAREGGGMYARLVAPTLINCTFAGNHASTNGGGVSLFLLAGQIPDFTNCVFTGNTADNDGGGFYSSHDYTKFTNCTFTNNQADGDGGGYCLDDNLGTVDFNNCIFWGNTAYDEGPQIAIKTPNPTVVTVNYSDVQGGEGDIYIQYLSSTTLVWDDVNNINVDPCFVDADGADDTVGTEDDDLHLLWDSLCINVGDPSVVFDVNERDIDDEPRVMVGRIDMGADEVGEKQADFTRNGRIDTEDLCVFVQSWLTTPIDIDWYILCDLIEDDQIDLKDYADFAADYLWQASWYEP